MIIVSEIKKKVEDRRAICNKCEHKTKNSIDAEVCGLCGCLIYAKTLTPGTQCPDEPPRWT